MAYLNQLLTVIRSYGLIIYLSHLMLITRCYANDNLLISKQAKASSVNTTNKLNTLPLNNLNPLLSLLASAPKQQQQQQPPAANNSRRIQFQDEQTNSQQQLFSMAKDSEEPIIKLDYSSINDEILRKRTANIVYYNANFNKCRHCFKFHSIWRELALDIRWWRQVVKLSTINCSDDDNIDVCRRAGVTQFPQVRFYWVMSQSLDQDGQRVRILGKSVHAMRHQIMDKVLESYNEHKSLVARAPQQRGGGGGTMPNPLQAFMPMLSQMLGGGSTSTSSSGLGGLMSMLTGGGGGGGGGQNKQQQQSPLAGLLGDGGGGGSMISFQGINELLNGLASISSWRKSLTIQPLPSNWPDFEPIDVGGDAQRLLDWLPLDASRGIGALLVMETQEFLYLGLEVMLDLSPYSNSTYLARVRDERSLLTRNLTKRDDVQAPALIYITENREARLLVTAPKYTNDEDLRRAFVRTFERRQVKHPVKRVMPRPSSGPTPSESSDSQEDEDVLNRVNNIYMGDLLNTIQISLMDQVFRHPDLSDDQYNALVKYIYALINYFPFDDDESRKFFTRLHAWLQNQVAPMDINEYKKQFHDVEEILGERRQWMGCKSLSNSKAIPTRSRKAGMLFDNPAQIGKVVSNITRLFRTSQQKAGELKGLLEMFKSTPIILGGSNSSSAQTRSRSASTTSAPSGDGQMNANGRSHDEQMKSDSNNSKNSKEESPIERLFSSLTNGSLGSDSSILKLISSALTGSSHNETANGKSKFAREYPCGAWKLAHVMVVNEYIKDSPRKDVKHIVIHSLYQYMMNFYACPFCGNRVSEVSGEFRLNLDDHLNDQGDSIMLLWKVHNRVNKRLESETRPGSPPKQQFPSESLCPKCRGPKAQNDITSTPNWHDKQVLNFLVHHYRPQNIFNSDASSSSSDSSSAATTVHNLMISLDLGGSHGFITIALSSISCLLQLKSASSLRWRINLH